MDDEDLEQLRREEQEKIINACLWRAGYNGYEIKTHYGLMFIFNKDKNNRKKLEWLKRYHEVLEKDGIKTTMYPDRHEPCMEVHW